MKFLKGLVRKIRQDIRDEVNLGKSAKILPRLTDYFKKKQIIKIFIKETKVTGFLQ